MYSSYSDRSHIYFHIMKKFTCIECFHMRSRWPYWCPTTIKRWPYWCPKPILWELNSFLMQTLSFGPINLHRCWPGEWKHSICSTYDFDPEAKTIILSCTFSPLCQLFGFFCKRISHVLQLLVEFVHFIFAYTTFSRFPSGAFQGLLRQKKRHFIWVSLYLMVILSDSRVQRKSFLQLAFRASWS